MMRAAASALVGLVFLTQSSPAWAQRSLKDIPDPDPEIERKSFELADGFAVNLFAADPILAKPIQMNFDAQGRLWVVSSEVYPQIKPGQEATDKVIVLTDADGDGRAEKTTVFADGLLVPTGIEPGDGGAYVANSTELIHLKDTDGDGRADARRIVLSGFGTEDTHHMLHTLRWGFDGMLYFNQSVYIHSHIETPYGVKRLGGGGMWQFRPESMQLDVFMRGLINPWGHHFDRWGQSFATDGAGGEGINYVIPGGSYASIPNPARYVQGLNPGSPKYCGAEVASGRHLPESWRGNILTNDFRGNRVCRFVLSEDGSGFAAREQAELIKTRHVAFRPIDLKMGPDGAIYIADWYNPIIQHGEVDFRDPRRDHTRGRIWRVTVKDRPLVERPKLVGQPVEALLDELKAREDWTRHFARRVLKERGADEVRPALVKWVQALDAADPEVEHHRLEALWTSQAIGAVDAELLGAVLRASDPHARAAATRVIAEWKDGLSDPLSLLAALVVDDHPRVRLEAVRVLAQVPNARSAEMALRALDRPTDRFLDYAIWLTTRELAPAWLPEVQAGRLDFGEPRHLIFALEAVGSPEVVKTLRDRWKSGQIPADQEERALGLIAALGAPGDLAMIFAKVLDPASASSARRARWLGNLIESTRQRKVRPEGDLTRLKPLLDGDDDALQQAAVEAIGVWRVEPLRDRLAALAKSRETSTGTRRAAIEALAQLGGPASKALLDQLCGPDFPAETRLVAATAMTSLDLPASARRAAEILSSNLSDADPADLFTRFLQRQGGARALAEALANHTIPADTAKIGIRLTGGSNPGQAALADALRKSGGLGSGSKPLSAQEREQLLADVARTGDPAKGEAVFRRKDTACLKCHSIAGAGGQVGPDLVSIGASAPVDYLLDSILDPQKAVKENYHALAVATSDGRIVTGIKVRQTDAELIVRDSEDQEVAIPLSAIEEQKTAGSLMPAGLAETLTRAELVDLVRFLSELGKVDSAFSVGRRQLARRWEAAEVAPEARGHLGVVGFDLGVTGGSRLRWVPAYSKVAGDLPLAELPRMRLSGSGPLAAFARAQIDVSTGGQMGLRFGSVEGLSVWLDGAPLEPQEMMKPTLSPGRHTLTFALDVAKRSAGLRCEMEEVAGSAAKAQWVGGK